MSATAFRILDLSRLDEVQAQILAGSAFGPFDIRPGEGGQRALLQVADPAWDALLLDVAATPGAAEIAEHAVLDIATLIVDADRGAAAVLRWLLLGAQDVLSPDELTRADFPQRLRAAVERKRLEREGRKSYATDLGTGLPHQQQLIEHMSHLLALREREPSPMAVLVLRVEGLATTEARMGRESANVLRRKVAVRLRAGVRASDVVASLGEDFFAVLLGAMLASTDGPRVGAKLMAALHEPFKVGGADVALAAALGVAQYPEDGTQPDALLRRAVGLAASAPAQGRQGHANFNEAGRAPNAANDE